MCAHADVLKDNMAERPRLTGSLRAFSGVSIPIAYSTADELRDELAEKRRRRNESKSTTWRDLRKIVDENCPAKDKRNVSADLFFFRLVFH